MPNAPTDALADLASVLGEENVQTLVRTFLRDFPVSLQELSNSERKNQHRVAHSLKSNSRLMGAMTLSERLAELEKRLEPLTGPGVTPEDIAAIRAEFETVAGPLRTFVGN